MKSYNSKDIRRSLKEVSIETGDIVMMHSSPITLGRFEGEGAAREIVETIREYLGETGTLIVPAFNFDFCKGAAFDRWKTPSKNMGVLSEAVRLLPEAKRSFHPMQSVAAVGEMAEDICERDTETAFSEGGAFDRLLELDAKLLLFGVTFNAASFVHLIEERLNVPYRYFKKFTGEYIDGEIKEQREYQLFVRDLELNPQLDIRELQAVLESEGKLKRARLGMGQIIACDFSGIYQTTYRKIKEDALYLLKNRDEVSDKLGLK